MTVRKQISSPSKPHICENVSPSYRKFKGENILITCEEDEKGVLWVLFDLTKIRVSFCPICGKKGNGICQELEHQIRLDI